MHIALVIERFDPFGGGAERSTAQIAAELVRRGHRVTVLTGQRRDADDPPDIEVVPWSRRVASSIELLGFSRWVRRRLADGPFDVSLSMTMAAPAAVLQPRGGTIRETLARNVAMRRDPARRALKQAMIRLTPKYVAQLAVERRTLADPIVRRVVAISQYVARQLQGHYDVPPQRIELIPNAAQAPAADAAQRQAWRAAVRTAFGVDDDATAFVFAAFNPALKGFEPLLEAMRLLDRRSVNAVLLLAGGLWYGHLARVCDLELRDRVRFIRQTRRMGPLYAAADATVLPTFYDPCSKVVIESLMAGVPAISSGYNGASDFITPRDGPPRGLVVAEPWDVEGLAQAMAAMADPQRRAGFAAATAGLDDQLTITRHVDRLEAVLRAAAQEAEAPSAIDGDEAGFSEPGLH